MSTKTLGVVGRGLGGQNSIPTIPTIPTVPTTPTIPTPWGCSKLKPFMPEHWPPLTSTLFLCILHFLEPSFYLWSYFFARSVPFSHLISLSHLASPSFLYYQWDVLNVLSGFILFPLSFHLSFHLNFTKGKLPISHPIITTLPLFLQAQLNLHLGCL